MFCEKCGTQLPDNSNFCTNCGHSFKSKPLPNILTNADYSEITSTTTDFLKSIFTSPIKSCSEYSKKLSNKFCYIYLAVITIVVSLIFTISFKFALNSIMSLFTGFIPDSLTSTLSESSYPSDYTGDSIVNTLLPFTKVFFYTFLIIVVFFGLIILFSYLIDNQLLKEKISFKKYLVVISVVLTFEAVTQIILTFFLTCIPTIFLIFFIISQILLLIILYGGLSSIKEPHKYDPYLFSLLYSISILLTLYLVVRPLLFNLLVTARSSIYNLF